MTNKQRPAGGDPPQDNTSAPASRKEASRELLALGLDIFLLRNSLSNAAQTPLDAPAPDEVWAQLRERAREVSRLRSQNMEDLYLKTQILLNVLEGRSLEICQILVKSIRDDAGFLLRKLEPGRA